MGGKPGMACRSVPLAAHSTRPSRPVKRAPHQLDVGGLYVFLRPASGKVKRQRLTLAEETTRPAVTARERSKFLFGDSEQAGGRETARLNAF